MPDAQLLSSYLRGEPDAVALIDDWIVGAGGAFRRRLGMLWEDVQQEIRTEVFDVLDSGRFAGRSSLRTYVWRIATNSCLDAVRRLDRESQVDPEPVFERLLSSEPSADLRLAREEAARDERQLVGRILRRIGQPCLELWSQILQGASYRAMAERLGVSEGTLRVRVLRCRQKARQLRRQLGSDGNGGQAADRQRAAQA